MDPKLSPGLCIATKCSIMDPLGPLFYMSANVLPLHLKQTFPHIIWIFTEGEGDGDGIESRLPFKIFSTLPDVSLMSFASSRLNKSKTWSVAIELRLELSLVMTELAVFNLNFCNPRIFSSSVFLVINR